MKLRIVKQIIFIAFMACSLKNGYAQLQADPVVAAALTGASVAETTALNGIKKEQKNIVAAQTVINAELNKIRALQKRTYDYLTNISGAVENARDIKKSYELTKQIYALCGELKTAVANNPQGLITTTVGTKHISQLTSEMTYMLCSNCSCY